MHSIICLKWNSDPHGGFTTGTPWMRVNEDFAQGWNVEAESSDPNSVLNFWKRAIALRKEYADVLVRMDIRSGCFS